MAESAKTMAATDYWKLLKKVLLNDEFNSLVVLENYITSQEHPDREEIVSLCLKWYAQRRQRRLLLDNVEEARLVLTPEPPLSEEAEAVLQEYGV